MQKYTGILSRVGSLDGGGWISSGNAVGNVRVTGKISIIEIGDKTFRNVPCSSDLYDLLDPGQEACLYIFRHFFVKPVVIGVKYPVSGKKYTLTFGQALASVLAYILLFPLTIGFTGMCIGLMGGKEGGLLGMLGIAWVVGGIGLSWLCSVWLLINYVRMRAD